MTAKKPTQAIVILAGGASVRMGRDKASLVIDGQTLLERALGVAGECGQKIVVAGRAAPSRELAKLAKFVVDDVAGQGPLGGVASALAHTRCDIVAFGCDMPSIDADMIRWLLEAGARETSHPGIAVTLDGRLEPLFSYYCFGVLEPLKTILATGRRSCHEFMTTVGFAKREIPERFRGALVNLNTPADVTRFERG